MGWLITPLGPADLAAVAALESAVPGAWSRAQLAGELQQAVAFQFTARPGGSKTIVAFICGRLVSGEAEIFKLTVAAAYRRQGLGAALLGHVLQYLRQQAAVVCFLELRQSNAGARRLYEKHGFAQLGIRKGYYSEPLEDAVIMQKIFACKR